MQTIAAAIRIAAFIAATSLLATVRAQAQDAQRQEFEAAAQAAKAVTLAGPSDVKLGEQAVLKLPAGMEFVPQPAAGRLMRAMGNSGDANLLGLVQSTGDAKWVVLARYEASGYVKDDDAREWNVDELFTSLQEGTEAANKERAQRGFPELEIIGWVQKPAYEAANHRLVWSMAARRKGQPDESAQSVNYNTYALGREGYISLNLITAREAIEQDKPAAHTLLSALAFNDGKRYEDFNSGTDNVAKYGLAALVAGVAVKKLGLFALAAAFFVKFAKLLLLAGIGVLAMIQKFVGGRRNGANPPSA